MQSVDCYDTELPISVSLDLIASCHKMYLLFFTMIPKPDSPSAQFSSNPSSGCVDIWEPKVLRAAMGAHFRFPIIPNLSWSEIQMHLAPATTVHVADSSTSSTRLSGTSRRQKKPGDDGWVSGRHISRKVYDEDEDEEDRVGGSRQTGRVLETQPYHMSWTGSHAAIVIGGETHGLSQEALQLAEETRGRRLVIPMVRGVDSLNAAMAASVLLFEGRRQLSVN